MSYDQIRLDKHEGIALLTLHRPERMNAFTVEMMTEIISALDDCDADDGVRAIIFTGDGERAFCAGADLNGGASTFDYDKQGGSESPVAADGTIDWSHDLVRDGGGRVSMRIFDAKKPVIGAINGAAVGVGATMTLPMDSRIASENARFGFVFARRGLVPEAASGWFLPRLVGIAHAVDLCYSGRLISATEALEKGLVQAVHKPGELVDAAIAQAREMTAESAPVSVALTRHMLWRMLGAAHPMSAHRWDSRVIFARGRGPDAAEGVSSFLEKRSPAFTESVANDYPWFAEFEDAPPYA